MGARASAPEKRRLCLQGTASSGVSTILRSLRLGEVQIAEPAVGFEIEVVTFKSAIFSAWTSGSKELWKPFYRNTDAIIFVVDCSKDLAAAKTLVHEVLLEETLDDCKVLIFANKQDLRAYDAAELTEGLELYNLAQDWHLQPCVAVNGGSGLYEGLDWLSAAVTRRPTPQREDDDICLTPVQLLFGDKVHHIINRFILSR